MMENAVIVLILIAIVTGILWYLARTKKRGERCIGCPYANQCAHKCGCTGLIGALSGGPQIDKRTAGADTP